MELQCLKQEKLIDIYNIFNDQLKCYLDLIQIIIVILDKNGNVIYINTKGCNLLGYERDKIIGKNWFDNFIPERIRVDLKSVFSSLIKGEIEPLEYYENPILTKEGTERMIFWHNSLIRDESNTVIGTISGGEDVTEIKRMEEKLIEQLNNINSLYKVAEGLIGEDLNTYKRAKLVTRVCVEDFGLDLAWVGIVEPDGSLTKIAEYPEDHPYTRNLIVRWDDSLYGQGPAGRAIRTREAQICEDVLASDYFKPWKERALKSGFNSSGAFPLLGKEKVVGVLNIYSKFQDFFTSERKTFFQNLAHLLAFALENASFFEISQKRLNRIQTLRNIDMAISGILDQKLLFNTILDEIMKELKVDAVDILRLNPYNQRLEYVAGKGFNTNIIESTSVQYGKGVVGRVASERKTIYIPSLREEQNRARGNFCLVEGFFSYYGTPLIVKGRVIGVLEVFYRSKLSNDNEWIDFLETLASQAAIAIDNLELFMNLYDSNAKLVQAYESTIEGWAKALELRDMETEGHSKRVAELTVKIAKRLGMRDEEIVHIYRGALLHDIGKLGVPDSILLKPGKLSEEEWAIMKMHPVHAYRLLSEIEYLRPAIDIPYCHHERWDGSGYPRGLKGEEIPISARIFAVVDVYDALTSDRPYRKALTKEEALEYIKEQSGKQFDPRVVEVFLEVIDKY